MGETLLATQATTRMAIVTCPICGNRFQTGNTTAMPFCSLRCQEVDLGRWFSERYGLSVEADEETLDEEATST